MRDMSAINTNRSAVCGLETRSLTSRVLEDCMHFSCNVLSSTVIESAADSVNGCFIMISNSLNQKLRARMVVDYSVPSPRPRAKALGTVDRTQCPCNDLRVDNHAGMFATSLLSHRCIEQDTDSKPSYPRRILILIEIAVAAAATMRLSHLVIATSRSVRTS